MTQFGILQMDQSPPWRFENLCRTFCRPYESREGDTRWLSWLSHFAARRKVAGSIPDSVIVIFIWLFRLHPGRIMALGLAQPLTERSTRNISWGVKACVWRITFMWRLSWNLGAFTSWNPQGLSRPVQGLLYLTIYHTWSLVTVSQILWFGPWIRYCRRLIFVRILSCTAPEVQCWCGET